MTGVQTCALPIFMGEDASSAFVDDFKCADDAHGVSLGASCVDERESIEAVRALCVSNEDSR